MKRTPRTAPYRLPGAGSIVEVVTSVREALSPAATADQQEAAIDMLDRLEADARALRAVRVLDAWAARDWDVTARDWRCGRSTGGFWCGLFMTRTTAVKKAFREFSGDTPDAARIAAADALLAEDPSLGEGL